MTEIPDLNCMKIGMTNPETGPANGTAPSIICCSLPLLKSVQDLVQECKGQESWQSVFTDQEFFPFSRDLPTDAEKKKRGKRKREGF